LRWCTLTPNIAKTEVCDDTEFAEWDFDICKFIQLGSTGAFQPKLYEFRRSNDIDIWVNALDGDRSFDKVRPVWWRPTDAEGTSGSARVEGGTWHSRADDASELQCGTGCFGADVAAGVVDSDVSFVSERRATKVEVGGVNVKAEIARVKLKISSAKRVREELGSVMQLIYQAAEKRSMCSVRCGWRRRQACPEVL
jgi:hypothetical protein